MAPGLEPSLRLPLDALSLISDEGRAEFQKVSGKPMETATVEELWNFLFDTGRVARPITYDDIARSTRRMTWHAPPEKASGKQGDDDA
ncbi:hypothetical protein L0Y65_03725 [Candidatus Micrarchaeota archaeon]|nr:hypothetical protein [Candidatus Micrarchaeota archaeon]